MNLKGRRSGLKSRLHRHNPLWRPSVQKVWDGPCWEGMPLSRCVGRCGSAHDSQLLECPEDASAVRRPRLFFLVEEPTIQLDEESEHRVENVILYSVAHRAVRSCKGSYAERSCVMWLRHVIFSLDVLYLWSGVSGACL